MPEYDTDGIIKNEFYHDAHDDTMHVRQTQPSEQLILDRNAELRRNPGAFRKLPWVRASAGIPIIMWMKVQSEGKYNLYDDKELNRWLKETPEGRACLLS